MDAQGTHVGCDIRRQMRDDMAFDILKRSVQAVEMDPEDIVHNLSRIIEDVLNESLSGINAEKCRLSRELEAERLKKQRTLEEFLDRSISKEDFHFMNSRCDERISKLLGEIVSIEHRQPRSGERADIRAAIREITKGERATDDFYGPLLHHMTIFGDGRAEVRLNFLSTRWVYTF